MSKLTIRERVATCVEEVVGFESKDLQDGTEFIKDLGIDSLECVELIMGVEDEFDLRIEDEQAEKVITFGQLVAFVEKEKAGYGP